MKKIAAIVVFAFICLGGVVYGAQNSNSSTTMQSDHNMSSSHGRRRHRRHHRRWHRRGRRGHNKNANMD